MPRLSLNSTPALSGSKVRPDGLGGCREASSSEVPHLLHQTRQSLNQPCPVVRAGGSSFLLLTSEKEKEIKSFSSQTTFPASERVRICSWKERKSLLSGASFLKRHEYTRLAERAL